MNSKLTPIWALPPTWLRFLVIVVLVLGVFFRFVNLDRKVYWIDEAYTSLRISGYTEAELVQQVSEGQVIGIKNLQKYQRTNSEKGVIDTIKGLAVEEPQLPPLYFVMARFWVQMWGYSVAVMRSLPALINLLAFPCIYWLCLELFESSLTRWVAKPTASAALALFAVSPFHVLYAQEARLYSLWTVTILLSSASLLRAMRLNTWRSWGIYAATVALGLYSCLYFALVAIGHGIYVVATVSDLALPKALRLRVSKTVAAFVLASVAGLLAFSPWIVVLITNWHNVSNKTSWLTPKEALSVSVLVRVWVGNLSRVFIDFGFIENLPPIYSIPLRAISLILLIMVGYSIYFLCCDTPRRVWLFILTLIGTTALALILPDLISGGLRSTVSRYLVPCYLGVQLAVAYLFATQITSTSIDTQRQKLWRLAMITLVSVGVLSCTISSQAETWWTKYNNYENPQFARIINSASQPLLLSDTKADLVNFMTIGTLLSLSYLLEPKVQLQLVVEPNIPKIPNGFSDVFILLKPSEALRYGLEKDQNYKIEDVYPDKPDKVQLWKLAKQ